jgi:hypothetical protein
MFCDGQSRGIMNPSKSWCLSDYSNDEETQIMKLAENWEIHAVMGSHLKL